MFTSTPDFTPFSYKTHQWPISCGDNASPAERVLTDSWDFGARPHTQPGLDDQVVRWMKGKQLQALTPRMKLEIEEREARRAAGSRRWSPTTTIERVSRAAFRRRRACGADGSSVDCLELAYRGRSSPPRPALIARELRV